MCFRCSCIRKKRNWQRLPVTTKFDFENESAEGPFMITWAEPCSLCPGGFYPGITLAIFIPKSHLPGWLSCLFITKLIFVAFSLTWRDFDKWASLQKSPSRLMQPRPMISSYTIEYAFHCVRRTSPYLPRCCRDCATIKFRLCTSYKLVSAFVITWIRGYYKRTAQHSLTCEKDVPFFLTDINTRITSIRRAAPTEKLEAPSVT